MQQTVKAAVRHPLNFTEAALVEALQRHLALDMRPSDFLHCLKKFGWRTTLNNEKVGIEASVRGVRDLAPLQVLAQQRAVMASMMRNWIEPMKIRCHYFFAVQMLPRILYPRLVKLSPFCWLPGGATELFPDKTRFWDVERLEAMNMLSVFELGIPGYPRHPGQIIRICSTSIDREAGCIRLGGTSVIDGVPYSRVKLSRTFNLERATHEASMPWARDDYHFTAMDMIEESERAAITPDFAGQLIPQFPALYFGFENTDLISPDATPGLKAAAYDCVVRWLKRGSPITHDFGEFAWSSKMEGSIIGHSFENLSGWESVEALLSEAERKEILAHVFDASIVIHDGLHLVPQQFLRNDSTYKPFKEAQKVYADMTGLLSRKVVRLDGGVFTDSGLGSIQMLEIPGQGGEPVSGSYGPWEYDLSGYEPGFEKFFDKRHQSTPSVA